MVILLRAALPPHPRWDARRRSQTPSQKMQMFEKSYLVMPLFLQITISFRSIIRVA